MTTTETATPYTKVFVGNLSFKTKADELAAEFSNAGKVVSANIITRGTRSLGYGFVEMENEEAAHKAVSLLNKRNVGGRDINVEVARPKAQLQAEREERIKNGEQPPRRGRGAPRGGHRGGNSGRGRRPRSEGGDRKQENGSGSQNSNNSNNNNNNAIQGNENSETPSGNSNQVRGNGPRGGANKPRTQQKIGGGDNQQKRSPAARGPKADKVESSQKTENGAPSSPSSEAPKARRGNNNKRNNRRPRDNSNRTSSVTTLFVANVPFSLRDEAFAELFKETSPTSAHVVITKTGRSKGFGFVEYADEEQQKAALAKLTELSSEGRKLAVKIALNPPERLEAPATETATLEAPKAEENQTPQ